MVVGKAGAWLLQLYAPKFVEAGHVILISHNDTTQRLQKVISEELFLQMYTLICVTAHEPSGLSVEGKLIVKLV